MAYRERNSFAFNFSFHFNVIVLFQVISLLRRVSYFICRLNQIFKGMVLLELITRKKIGENGFARRTPAKLFALEAEEVRQESPPDAPDSLLNLAAM